MLHPSGILLGHFVGGLARDLSGGGKEVLLAVVQALSRGGRGALDGAAACHVGLSIGDGGDFGLGNGTAFFNLGDELFSGREFPLHCESTGRVTLVVSVGLGLSALLSLLSAVSGGWSTGELVLVGGLLVVQWWKKST